MKNINISVGGFHEKQEILISILDYFNKYSHHKYNDTVIDRYFDCFPQLKWAGGRTVDRNREFNFNYAEETVRYFNKIGVGLFATFTNKFIDKGDLQDEHCNNVLELLSGGEENGVVVNSEILEHYIKENYPSINILLSVTKFYPKNEEKLHDAIKNGHSIVVLPPEYNTNYSFLDKICYPDKLEVIINETCIAGCKLKELHYDLISIENRYNDERKNNIFICSNSSFQDERYLNLLLTRYDILYLHHRYNINRYKFSGRGLSDRVYLLFLCYYLVKPNFKEHFLNHFNLSLPDRGDLLHEIVSLPAKEKIWH